MIRYLLLSITSCIILIFFHINLCQKEKKTYQLIPMLFAAEHSSRRISAVYIFNVSHRKWEFRLYCSATAITRQTQHFQSITPTGFLSLVRHNPSYRYRASEDSGTILSPKRNSMTSFIFISLSPNRYQSVYGGNGADNQQQIFMYEHRAMRAVP